ncbi:MAG TPA: hypothetical protein VFZ23_15150 [Pyrinomonadaceae bacterium]
MKSILILLTVALCAGNSFAQGGGELRILDTENHIVTASKKGASIVFTMEAIADFTEDRDSSRSLGTGWDYAGIRVDINNNNVVDRGVDVAFGLRQKTNIFCAQYLIQENASSGCGGLRSKGKARVGFMSTISQATPHPVHVYEIPLAELARGGGKIGLTFVFSDASTGRSYYPSRRNPRSFNETIQLDLSELDF